MRAVLWAVLSVCVLSACGAPPPTQQTTSLHDSDSPLSARGPSRETSDEACANEARALDTALRQRARGAELSTVFDQLASCRHTAAKALILAQSQGQIPRARAAADLIGLRGAMRRDVSRVETVFFTDRPGGDLRTRALAARDRQDQLILRDG